MAKIQVQRNVSADPSTVYAILNDFGGIHHFHPLVERSPLQPGSPESGIGAERICYFYNNRGHVAERVTETVQDQSLTVEVTGGTMPFKEAIAHFEVTPTPTGNTQLVLTMDYTPKMGILGKAMNALIMKRKVTGMLTLLLAALDEHLKTGAEIGNDFKLKAA